MQRWIVGIGLLLLALLLAPASYAQGDGVGPQVTDASWLASYWNNKSLSGQPVLVRQENAIAYAATYGSFAPGVNADGFSARFEKYIDVQSGSYRFTATSDDGVRLYVDGRAVIDKWFDQASRTYSADIPLTTGYHYVVVEYYDNTQAAQLQVSWGAVTAPPPAPGAWKAEYWTNRDLSGTPAVTTTAAEVSYDWGTGAPVAGIPADNWSARYSRTVNLARGTYRFTATSDDGVRLFVAGRPVIDQWQLQAARTFTYDIYLPGGNTDLRVEYFEASGGAQLKVRWEALSGSVPTPVPAPVGEVIVDNTSPGFRTGGSARSWRTEREGFGGSLLWTKNNRTEQPGYNWGRWYPTLSAGQRYEVYVYIPNRFTTTTAATYWVSHRGGFSKVIVNQDTQGDKWVSLGTYTFQGSDRDYVSLNDITGESAFTRLIAWDAAKFVPR